MTKGQFIFSCMVAALMGMVAFLFLAPFCYGVIKDSVRMIALQNQEHRCDCIDIEVS